MEEGNSLFLEKMACLFLLKQALEDNDKEKAFILAMKIEEINNDLKKIDEKGMGVYYGKK